MSAAQLVLKDCRPTTWSCLVVLLVFCSAFNQATAQLNLYLSKEDAKQYLKMDFQGKLYLIQAGVPATMVQNPTAFYHFMAPIKPSVAKIRISWYSSPQVSHYSFSFHSSDANIMPDPVASIPLQGIVQQSTEVFQVSFHCSGKKAGQVDMTYKLNYTAVVSGTVDTEDVKPFTLVIRRECLKTSSDGDDQNKNDNNGSKNSAISKKSPSLWSRGMIVGLSAGLALVFILTVGIVLLCCYVLRQRKRKLKMDFEEDLEMYRSSSSKIYKSPKVEEDEVDEPPDVSKTGLFYSPPKSKFAPPEGSGRINTSGSDSSITQLIIPEESGNSSVADQPEGKHSSRDARHSSRHKHRRYQKHYKADTKYSWMQEKPSSSSSLSSYETESLLERRNTPDEAQNTESLFTALNDFWAAELADILLSKDQLSIGEPLKRGTIGCLYKGAVRGLFEDQPRKKLDVSIKALQEEADMDTITSFIQEALIIKGLKHPNVIELVGVVLQRAAPPYIVTPLTRNGDLAHFLKISRATSARLQTLTSRQLVDFGIEICSGMDYIAQKQIVHRNLAAKNCMVGDDLRIKIADFSLAKDVNSTNLNDKGIRSRLLVKWTAPESLKEEGQFSEKSDVWSFGVILWELVTLAKAPYQAIDNSKMEQHLQAGQRLPQPSSCPYDLYLLMKNCWESNRLERPTFSLLLKQLEHFATRLTQNGVKFEYLTESNC